MDSAQVGAFQEKDVAHQHCWCRGAIFGNCGENETIWIVW